MSLELDALDRLAASVYDGYLVRKDLVRNIAPVSRTDVCCRVPVGPVLCQH